MTERTPKNVPKTTPENTDAGQLTKEQEALLKKIAERLQG